MRKKFSKISNPKYKILFLIFNDKRRYLYRHVEINNLKVLINS